jgi:hypothetical protein
MEYNITVTIIMDHECKKWTVVRGGISGRRWRKGEGTKWVKRIEECCIYNINYIYIIHIYIHTYIYIYIYI